MKILDNLLESLHEILFEMDMLDIRNSIFIFFAFLLASIFAGTYYVYSETTNLTKKLKVLDNQLLQVMELKNADMIIQAIEQSEQKFLEKNSLGSTLKSFLEQKITSLGLNAEPNWKDQSKATSWLLSPSLYEEEKANIKLNKITTENMVNFLKAIQSNNALIIREFSANKQQGSLNVSALISYRYKKS